MMLVSTCKCGSTEFHIEEVYWHSASIEPERPGTLLCKAGSDGGVERVICAKCDAPAPAELEIEFC